MRREVCERAYIFPFLPEKVTRYSTSSTPLTLIMTGVLGTSIVLWMAVPLLSIMSTLPPSQPTRRTDCAYSSPSTVLLMDVRHVATECIWKGRGTVFSLASISVLCARSRTVSKSVVVYETRTPSSRSLLSSCTRVSPSISSLMKRRQAVSSRTCTSLMGMVNL